MSKIRLASIHQGDEPITRLYPGWRADKRHPIVSGLEVLILKNDHEDREACWWLSSTGELLACHSLALPASWSQKLVDALQTDLHRFYIALLCGQATLDQLAGIYRQAQQGLFPLISRLPLIARLQLISLWFRKAQADTAILPPSALLKAYTPEEDELRDVEAPSTDATPNIETPFSPALIHALLNTHPAGTHTLACSPFTGNPLRAELVMPTEEGTAYRFTDDEKSQTFYLFWARHHPYDSPPSPSSEPVAPAETNTTPSFYYPAGNVLLGDDPLTPLFPVFLLYWFINHPHCVDLLKEARVFHLEDYGVGRASALWQNINKDKKSASPTLQESTGQTLSSYPFSSMSWGDSSLDPATDPATSQPTKTTPSSTPAKRPRKAKRKHKKRH